MPTTARPSNTTASTGPNSAGSATFCGPDKVKEEPHPVDNRCNETGTGWMEAVRHVRGSAISLAAVAGLGFALAQIANREVNSRAMASAASTAGAIADGGIEPNLGNHQLTGQLGVDERTTLTEATSALRRSRARPSASASARSPGP